MSLNLNKFELMERINSFVNYDSIYARQVLNFAKLLQTNTADSLARFDCYSITNTIDANSKQIWLQQKGRLCASAYTSNFITGATNANDLRTRADLTFVDALERNQKYCDMFLSQDSLYYKIGPSTSSVRTPLSNVDMFMLVLSKLSFESDNDIKNVYGLAINSVYSYENLVKAVSKFPAFCDIQSTVLACKQ
jgi:hypothetical protein